MMARKEAVDAEEERLRSLAAELPRDRRAAFHRDAALRLRDPDTYAALNWFFLAGLHHFYLGRWLRGAVNLTLFFGGIVLLFLGEGLIGLALIVLVTVAELWALFRSQIIVQDRNNALLRALLREHGGDPDTRR